MHHSPRGRLRFGLRMSFLACMLVIPALAGAEKPQPPPYYAITNVRVVSGAGEPLENVTVLLANGLIEAIGAKVQVPADAWVVDGEGLTLYPGLIDAMTTLGQKKPEEPKGSGGSGGGPLGPMTGPPIRGPEDRPKTTPWIDPANELAEDKRIEKWRSAGFTSAVTTPEAGIFTGQATVINLGDGEGKHNVVATPVAQRLNFKPGDFRSFPGSLMGVLSYVKQVFLDTQHYTKVRATYEDDPNGRVRPEHDRTLEPLATAMASGTPFLMPGNLGREIDRALAIRDAFDLSGIIYGAHGAHGRIEQLKAAKTPVLVSLKWPEARKDRDPEADTPFRTLHHRRFALTTPALLAEAGVPFAFYSAGITSTSDVFKGVRKAVEAGLSNEDALEALSADAAGIFGIADRVGTIETGKIANLILASDWPWADGAEIAAVFVDGRKYQERKDEEPGDAPAMDVSGTWAINLQTPGGPQDMNAEIEMKDDGKVTGEIESPMGNIALDDGKMSGNLLRFKITSEFGGRPFTGSWSLTVEGEQLSGSMSVGPMQMEATGERTAKPAAKSEQVASDEGDTPSVSLAELREGLDTYQGPVRRMKSFAVTNVDVWTVSGETIENGTVVVQDGKIKAVGRDVRIPKNAEIIDGAGGSLIPGIMDAHSHIAIEGGVNEGSLNVTAMVAIGDVVNPDDVAIYRALAGGVTTANLLHGSANPIGGQNQVVKLRWGADAEGMKFEGAPNGIKFALGENPKRSNLANLGMPERYPKTRMGVMDVIRQAFVEAREYRKAWKAYEKGKKSKGLKPTLPPRDLEHEAVAEILEGKRLVHSHCYRADEILQLLRLTEAFDVRVATLQHVLEGYKVADEIAAHGAGASTFSDWWGYKVEAYDAIPYNAALMAERNVVVSINSDSGEEMRHLNQEAAKAVKWGGMSEIEALKLVTLNPAKQFGLADRIGSIEVGKDADLVLYDGHPLAIHSVVQKTFIDGDLYFDAQADRERQALIDGLKKRMLGKDEKGEGGKRMTSNDPTPEVYWSDGPYSCQEDH